MKQEETPQKMEEIMAALVPLYQNVQLSRPQTSNKFLKLCRYRRMFPDASITNNIIDSFPTA